MYTYLPQLLPNMAHQQRARFNELSIGTHCPHYSQLIDPTTNDDDRATS
jgi:hypothetical protein